ncbi:M15 family metallopeptidase [Paenibacillus sp. sgz302251]|uniref:M15 family metallopeptidase n=1 Tax=Paenibacillus sp. sgz302251 TaxID=3414493 RepID=UPI003C7B5D1D
MIERNSLHQHPMPVGRTTPDTAARSRRKRNRLLLFITLLLSAIILWRAIWELERSLPPIDIIPNEISAPPVKELHPSVFAKQTELIAQTKKADITILITDGFRSNAEQDAIYAKGRTTGGSIVTQVRGGGSYHNYGLAIDFALRTKEGEVVWDMEYDGNGNGHADWMEVVEIAKRLGFSWGGDWDDFPDYPHLQMDFGYSIRELQRGQRPPVEQLNP